MKKALTILTGVAVLAATSMPRAMAGDREWATAGKVLAGVGAGLLLAKTFEPAPVVYQTVPTVIYSAPVVAPVPVVIQPAPVIVTQTPAVVYQPQVVYVQPAPAYVTRAPVWVAPAPVFGVHFGFGVGHYRHHRR